MGLNGAGLATLARPLRGRDEELDVLRDVLDRARSGVGGAALIEGEAGIGKSRLVAELLADSGGFEVFAGRAEELERSRPFSGAIHALRTVRRAAEDVLRVEAGTGDGDVRIADALVDLLEERALRRPVLLFLDDLHWADPSTLLFFRAAARRADGIAFAVVGTFRPPHDQPELAHVIDRCIADGAALVRLGPLTQQAIDALARDAVGAAIGRGLTAEISRAAGNPLYILELMGAFDEEGLVECHDGLADLKQAIIPPSFRLTVLRRVSALPAVSVDALRMASLLGSTFVVDDLQLIIPKATLELLDALEPAIRAGFVKAEEDRLAFRHDLVRDALYDDIPLDARRKLHRRLADAMAAAGRPITTVGEHMSLGATKPDLQAFAWLYMATFAVAGQSASTGARFIERAIDLAPAAVPQFDRALAAYTNIFALIGRSDSVITLAEDMLSRELEPAIEIGTRHGLGYAYADVGRFDDAIKQREIILDMFDEASDAVNTIGVEVGVRPPGRASLLGELAVMLFEAGDVIRTIDVSREAIATAESTDDLEGLCVGHMELSFALSSVGAVDDALSHAMDSVRYNDVLRERGQFYPTPKLASGLLSLEHDDAGRALTELARGLDPLEDVQTVSLLFHRELALAHYVTGGWSDALAFAAAGMSDVEVKTGTMRLIACAVDARIRVHRGDFDGADLAIASGDESFAARSNAMGRSMFLWAKVMLLEARGDVDGAVDALAESWRADDPFMYLFGMWRFVWPDFVRLAVQAGHTELGREISSAAQPGHIEGSQIASLRAAVLRIRGHAESKVELLVEAADLYATAPRLAERAAANEDAGAALATAGDNRAPDYLGRALDTYDELGAVIDADRVNAELRRLGVRRGRRGARRRPEHGWDALTPTELRVVELVAEGLTNVRIGERLFISRRTVQTHLRNVFDKLGAASRAEVAAAFARRGAT